MSSSVIWKKKSFSKLTFGFSSRGGRTSSGRISVYHRGGGAARLLRVVDFKRFVWNVPGVVARIEYNPVVQSLISLLIYCNGVACYTLTPSGLQVGMVLQNSSFFYPTSSVGSCFYLSSFPVGTFIHNVESHRYCGGQFLRSMGSYGRIMSKSIGAVVIKLRSGRFRVFSSYTTAGYGTLDAFHFLKKLHNKAGFFRLKGFRPVVRGVAMNPVDHPHGGGEGKSSAGRPSVSRWGWLTKNVKGKKD